MTGAVTSTRTRVLWLVKGLGRGGAEQLLAGCVRHLSTDRYDVEVAYVLPWKDALVPDLEAAGIPVHCIGSGTGRDPRWVFRLRKLVAERRYDLIHTHMPVPAVAARVVLRKPAPTLVHTEHNLWSRYRKPTRWANSLTYPRNTAVIAVSQAVADEIDQNRLGGRERDRLTVIHHGIDRPEQPTGDRSDARARLGLPSDAFVVGSVGNLTPKKDQRTLVDAIGLLRREVPTARLVLIGAGPLETELRAHVKQRGLDDVVLLAGSRGDVRELLPGFDAFSLSSRQEGLPVSVMEAMVAGLPIAATAVGGLPEMIDDGTDGLLVPAGDAPALAGAIGRIAKEPGLAERLATGARRRSSEFDAATAQRQIESVYARALAVAS
jgi:glycosyltransferase involved in cell wall biosynthesis